MNIKEKIAKERLGIILGIALFMIVVIIFYEGRIYGSPSIYDIQATPQAHYPNQKIIPLASNSTILNQAFPGIPHSLILRRGS